jgi:hypothetical protein
VGALAARVLAVGALAFEPWVPFMYRDGRRRIRVHELAGGHCYRVEAADSQ